jgi:hypothetical protein
MRRASLLFNGLAALVALAIVVAAPPGRAAAGPRFQLADFSGALRLSNSKAGQAILSGEKLRPGQPTSGTVALVNTGDVRAAFAVEAAMEAQTGTGRLWDALQIVVTDITVPADPFAVYQGRLADMGRVTFGGLATGRQRAFEFTLSLPRDAADNSFQGASLSLGLTWSAQAVSSPGPTNPPPPPAPTPSPSPTPTPTPTPAPRAPQATPTPAPPVPTPVAPTATPTPAPPHAPAVNAEDVLTLPSPKSCVSRRKFVIRVRAPRGVSVTSTTVFVNNRKAGSSRRPSAVISLKGLPRGKVKVKVVALLSDGRQLVLRRTYQTCTSRARR